MNAVKTHTGSGQAVKMALLDVPVDPHLHQGSADESLAGTGTGDSGFLSIAADLESLDPSDPGVGPVSRHGFVVVGAPGAARFHLPGSTPPRRESDDASPAAGGQEDDQSWGESSWSGDAAGSHLLAIDAQLKALGVDGDDKSGRANFLAAYDQAFGTDEAWRSSSGSSAMSSVRPLSIGRKPVASTCGSVALTSPRGDVEMAATMGATRALPSADLSRYQLCDTIGEGLFAKVVCGMDKATRKKVAIKIITAVRGREAEDDDDDDMGEADEGSGTPEPAPSEAALLTQFQGHRNIVQLLDWVPHPSGLETLVMELSSDGDLQYALERYEVDPNAIQGYMFQISSALGYVHAKGYVHNDVKLENILLFGHVAKLCDFGLAGPIGEVRHGVAHGTTVYMAPELLEVEEDDDYTLSTRLYHVMFASLPWQYASNDDEEYEAFASDPTLHSTNDMWKVLTPGMRCCLLGMLCPDPRFRTRNMASIAPALQGSWIGPTELPDIPIYASVSTIL